MTPHRFDLSRRDVLRLAATCGGYLALLRHADPVRALRVQATAVGEVVATEPFARLEKIADGVWAAISTPLEGARTTLCNGGIVAGRDGVLVVDGFASADGARWLAGWAKQLAGRWPDEVVLTHYHGDHSGGLEGYDGEGEPPRYRSTGATRERLQSGRARTRRQGEILEGMGGLDGAQPTTIDLGGRVVRVHPRSGHTGSDVTVELEDPSVVFCGDLVWNQMFPNYMDATPSELSAAVRALRRERETAYVPGHGPLAGAGDYERFLLAIDSVERAARRAHERGEDLAAAARAFRLPEEIADWILFSPSYFEVAFSRWKLELVEP
jgi:glyoxylase-like metal-dependent hydrolase (beta-lactamase superfamily II)